MPCPASVAQLYFSQLGSLRKRVLEILLAPTRVAALAVFSEIEHDFEPIEFAAAELTGKLEFWIDLETDIARGN